MKHCVVTGGAGYIGSHTVLTLLNSGYKVTVLDSFVNSNVESLKRLEKLTENFKNLSWYKVDLEFKQDIFDILKQIDQIDSCIHFAGLKSVGESVQLPSLYYRKNLISSINLIDALKEFKIKKFIFSSSATVYGNSESPLDETSNVGINLTNPYGKTKYMIEEMLKDFSKSEESTIDGKKITIVILRYFNPIGAHESGLIGEDPNDIPNNLMPYISQVSVNKRPFLNVYADPPFVTKDGTGIRDYIHVCDLADAHLASIQYIPKNNQFLSIFNLGTGIGYSVLELIKTYEKVSGKKINYKIVPRRPGDVAITYTKTELSEKLLTLNGKPFKAKRDVYQMCKDLWNWQKNNPNGYNAEELPDSNK